MHQTAPLGRRSNLAACTVIVLYAPYVFAALPPTATAKTRFGDFVFTNLKVTLNPPGKTRLTGKILNRTTVDWSDLVFGISLEMGKPAAFRDFEVRLPRLLRNQSSSIDTTLEFGDSAQSITGLTIWFAKGDRDALLDPDGKIAEREAELRKKAETELKKADAELRRLRVEEDRRKKELAKLPALPAGTPVAADTKCLEQTIEAAALDGLAKRKKMAELMTYKCIFVLDAPAPVRVDAKDRRFTKVTVMDGSHTMDCGWVLTEWLR